jgi:polyferredoxin
MRLVSFMSTEQEAPMAKKMSKIQVFRRILLGFFLGGFTLLAILHQKLQGIPSVDALDPFGGLETLFKWLARGEFIKKITPGNIVLLGAIVVLGIVLSRFFCGWLCAFGALQGVFGWIGKKLFKRRFEVPKKLDRVLRWTKYLILVLILYGTWTTGELIIRPYDPLAAYAHLPSGLAAVWSEFAVGFILLVAFMVLSMFYERAFCKYACPLGAVNAILSRVPLFRIKRDKPSCIACARCDKVCPMNIDVSHAEMVTSAECIDCLECVTACPTKKDTLVPTIGGKNIKGWTVVIIGLGIYVGAALIGQISGMLRFTAPTLNELSSRGALTIADIKGSTTYDELATAFGVDLDQLYRRLGIDKAKVSTSSKIKDTGSLAGIEGFETDTVRFAVADMLGLPYSGESTSTTPKVAPPPEPSAKPEALPSKPSTIQTAPQNSATPQAVDAAAPVQPASPSSLTIPEGFKLEGTMTIQDVAKALNATTQQVIDKLGLPKDLPLDRPLREMGSQYGYTMPQLKERIAQ